MVAGLSKGMGRDMRRRLGEILVAEGVIDAGQLQAALAEAALLGRRVGEVLVSRGDVTEAQILGALAAQLGVEVAPLATTAMLPKRLLKLIPAALARDRLVLPVFLDAQSGMLEVAMADPADHELLDELRFRTGHDIRPMVAMASEVAEAVDRFYFDGQATPTPTPSPAQIRRDTVPLVRSQHLASAQVTRPVSPAAASEIYQHGLMSEPLDDLPSVEADADIDTLRAQVGHLRGQLSRAYAILQEASAAHAMLLAMLDERGVVDRHLFERRLRERLDSLKGG